MLEIKLKEQLAGAGMNVEDGVERVSGNEALYIKLLKKFPNDKNYERFVESMKSGAHDDAAIYMHTLKGLSANLGMNKLYEYCCEADADFKAGNLPLPSNIEKIRENYTKIVEIITEI